MLKYELETKREGVYPDNSGVQRGAICQTGSDGLHDPFGPLTKNHLSCIEFFFPTMLYGGVQ